MTKHLSAFRFGVWIFSLAAAFAATAFCGANVRGADGKLDPSAAAFVDSETALVVRVDLAQIDLDRLSEYLVQNFAQALQYRGFDQNSVLKTTREFKLTVAAGKDALQPFVDRARQEFGLQEAIYITQQLGAFDSNRVVVPLSAAKRAGLKPLVDGFAASARTTVEETKTAFVLAPAIPGAAEYYAKFKPSANQRLETFLRETNGDATVQIYWRNDGDWVDSLLTTAQENAPDEVVEFLENPPQEIEKAFASLEKYLIDAKGTIDLNELKYSFQMNFTSAEHANEVVAGLQKGIDLASEALEKAIAENDAEQIAEYNVPALVRTTARALMLSRLPKRDGVVLRFEGRFDAKTLGNPSNVGAAGVLVGVLLPAVKAARARAMEVRMQNMIQNDSTVEVIEVDESDEIQFEE